MQKFIIVMHSSVARGDWKQEIFYTKHRILDECVTVRLPPSLYPIHLIVGNPER